MEAWLMGSVVTGVLHEAARVALVLFCVIARLASLPFFAAARTEARTE
jgi:hypothetical protein